jgi:hypothetical protein
LKKTIEDKNDVGQKKVDSASTFKGNKEGDGKDNGDGRGNKYVVGNDPQNFSISE